MDPFGKRLRHLRSRQGIGLKKLAPELGVTYGYLSKLENELISPSPAFALKVANYFGEDPDVMLLAAGRVPRNILRILQDQPEDAIAFLRERFTARERRSE